MKEYKLTVGLIGCKNEVLMFSTFESAMLKVNQLHHRSPKKLELITGKGFFDRVTLLNNR